MNIEGILYKISGDLVERKEILDEIKKFSKDYSKVIDIILGFGTEFSHALNEAEISFRYADETIEANGKKYLIPKREIEKEREQEGLEKALEIYNKEKADLTKELGGRIKFKSPIKRRIDGTLENKNADKILAEEGNKYDKIIIYTKEGRDKSIFTEIFGGKAEIRYCK